MRQAEEIIAERFAPDEDEGYFIAPPESDSAPTPESEQKAISLTPKQLAGLQRTLAALAIGVSATHPRKNKRKNRQKARGRNKR